MKGRVRQQLLIFFLVLPGTVAYTQDFMNKFLLSANTDHELTSLDEQIRYLETKPYRLSPVQKLEFRAGSNQLDPERQEYGLRLNPANPWENKNNRNYFKQYQSVLSLEKGIVLKTALILRYQHIIELWYYKELVTLKEEDLRLVTNLLAVLERQQYSEFFKGDEYLNLKLQHMDKTVEREEAVFEYDNQWQRMVALNPGLEQTQATWDAAAFISVTQIEQVVDSIFMLTEIPSTLAYREKQIDLANQEYKLEKSNINVGFVQAEYQEFRIDQNRKPWNINLGVTIPITNPNKGDMTKRKLEVIEAEHERDETKAEIQSDKEVARSKIKSLILRYRDIHQKIESLRVSALAGTLNTLKDNNPTASLRFEGNLLKLKSIEIKLKQEILFTYIEFLGFTDTIQKLPLINYLTNDLAEIGLEN